MSLVEEIERLHDDSFRNDESYIYLSDALKEYHRMIDEGIITPRGNTIQEAYTIYSCRSNVSFSVIDKK